MLVAVMNPDDIGTEEDFCERLIRECVPGGCSCDPQDVADAIRAFFRPYTETKPKITAKEHFEGLELAQEEDWGEQNTPESICPTCNGSGQWDDATPCPDCDGQGDTP